MTTILRGCLLCLGLAAMTAGGALADVVQRANASAIWFDGGERMTNGALTITGPDNYATTVSESRGLPAFRLQTAGRLSDGLYQYALSAATDERIETTENELDNGRSPDVAQVAYKPFSMYGAFRISRGAIVTDLGAETGSDQDPVE